MGFPALRCTRGAVGWGGVYHPQCQRAAEYLRSQEVRGMMGGDERKEGGVTRERERGRERQRETEGESGKL